MPKQLQSPAYDAFGDPVAAPRWADVGRGAHQTAIALFWSLVLVLVAGRIYAHDLIANPASYLVALAIP